MKWKHVRGKIVLHAWDLDSFKTKNQTSSMDTLRPHHFVLYNQLFNLETIQSPVTDFHDFHQISNCILLIPQHLNTACLEYPKHTFPKERECVQCSFSVSVSVCNPGHFNWITQIILSQGSYCSHSHSLCITVVIESRHMKYPHSTDCKKIVRDMFENKNSSRHVPCQILS